MSEIFTTTIGLLSHLPGMHYLHIPKKIVQLFGAKNSMRFVCIVNNSLRFQGGLVALGSGDFYITISNHRMRELDVKVGDTVQLKLEKDSSEYGMEMPLELEAVLAQDADAKERFQLLSAGKKRYIIGYVATVKNSDKRIERALLLLTNLKRLPVGKESFREMLGLPRERE